MSDIDSKNSNGKNFRANNDSDNEKNVTEKNHSAKKIKINSEESNVTTEDDNFAKDLNKTKGDLKQELIEYYENIKNKIDIKSQGILLKIDKYLDQKKTDISQERTNEINVYRKMILKINKSFVQSIDEICDKNMSDINNYNEIINDKDYIKKNILKSYCLHIENQNKSKIKFPIGIIITFDWYPSENEIRFLIIYFYFEQNSTLDFEKDDELDDNLNYEIDQDVINLISYFDRYNISETSNDIFHLKKNNILDYSSNLKTLYLELIGFEFVNLCTRIKENTFLNFKYLEELYIDSLSENTHFDKNALNGLKNLKKLVLNVDLAYPYDINYELMPNLETLCINNAEFDEIESHNIRITNLKSLIFKESKLELTSGFLKSFNNLENVCFKNCYLSVTEKSLFSTLNNIISLNIVNTQFNQDFDVTINDLLEQTPCLRTLKINSNDFIENCTSDENARLISKLDELVLVKSDNFDMNELFDIKNFKSLRELKRIKLSFIDEPTSPRLNQSFFSFLANNYTKIEYIKISYLNKADFEENAFASFINLKSLRLSNCKIRILDNKLFNGLINLEILDLQSNKINSIDPNTFDDLTNLKSLDLSNNNIENLDSNCFKAFDQKLDNLNLRGNSKLKFNDKDIEEFKKFHNLNDSVHVLYDEKKTNVEQIDLSNYHKIFIVS